MLFSIIQWEFLFLFFQILTGKNVDRISNCDFGDVRVVLYNVCSRSSCCRDFCGGSSLNKKNKIKKNRVKNDTSVDCSLVNYHYTPKPSGIKRSDCKPLMLHEWCQLITSLISVCAKNVWYKLFCLFCLFFS